MLKRSNAKCAIDICDREDLGSARRAGIASTQRLELVFARYASC